LRFISRAFNEDTAELERKKSPLHAAGSSTWKLVSATGKKEKGEKSSVIRLSKFQVI
jgi:hypothetical protein